MSAQLNWLVEAAELQAGSKHEQAELIRETVLPVHCVTKAGRSSVPVTTFVVNDEQNFWPALLLKARRQLSALLMVNEELVMNSLKSIIILIQAWNSLRGDYHKDIHTISIEHNSLNLYYKMDWIKLYDYWPGNL